MKFVLNGLISNESIKLFKAADHVLINGKVINDNGTVEDLTTDTITLEVYDTVTRKNAASLSFALTTLTAANGTFTLTPTAAQVTLAQGTYYAYLKHVSSTTVTTITSNYYIIQVG